MATTPARPAGLAARVLLRPRLWPMLLRTAWRFRRRDWYRRPPFLPLPPRRYLAWRLHTAYADERALPPAPELERYLRWTDRMRRMRRAAVREADRA